MVSEVIATPVLLVICTKSWRGLVKPPDESQPTALSVEVAVTPFAKLYDPPDEVPLSTPAPVVPAACVVAVAADENTGVGAAESVLQPVGNVAVAEFPIPSKFSVKAAPIVVILDTAAFARK
jgi:hypothetical protein